MTDAPNHAIFPHAVQSVGDALLAHTLAECLYWYQKASHRIDGELAVWKTGPELEKVLGIRARTANQHMKRLAQRGYWRLVRRPRPGYSSPSPVTWIIPEEAGLALLRRAQGGEAPNSSGATNATTSSGPSKGVSTDLQMSVGETSLQLPSLPSGQSHFSCPPDKQGMKAKSKAGSWDPGKKASQEAKDLLSAMNAYRIEKNARLWDPKSQFTWAHMEALACVLKDRKVPSDDWPRFAKSVHQHWPYVLLNLPELYQHHPTNVGSPSSRPLGDEAETVVSLVLKLWADEAAKAVPKTTGGKFKM